MPTSSIPLSVLSLTGCLGGAWSVALLCAFNLKRKEDDKIIISIQYFRSV